MSAHNILIKPVITEQSMAEAALGTFTFVVAKSANKTDIKKVLKVVFDVNVVSVSTNIVKGKRKKVGKRRTEVADSVWKKARVTLKPGEKIALFEPGGGEEKKK
jgi:large subunit ribosomal protein L23